MKILLVTPPMTQLNSPYPATPYLKAHLVQQGHEVRQIDLGLELGLALFSKAGLERIRAKLKGDSESVEFFKQAFEDYADTIEAVIRFLQGRDSSLALRIAQRTILPEGPRFVPLQEHGETLLGQFGEMGLQDLAKYRASLYLDDIADVIRDGIDPRFEFSRYGESLASSQNSFTPLVKSLKNKTLVDEILLELFDKHLQEFSPELVGFSVPFPGNVYGALRLGDHLAKIKIPRVMGGGFVNTELRELEDPRVFDYIDYLVFDDGEAPLDALLAHIEKGTPKSELGRVKYREGGKVITAQKKIAPRPFAEIGAPDYSDLPLSDYVPMMEMPNPMFRMWSDFRWNKMVLAHGCYWKKCTFCDVNLDYIGRFEPQKPQQIVDAMEKVAKQTGSTGFHFVDEAAPPALLKAISEEILRRRLKFTWWGNLRFDKYFTKEVAELMADAGCVAVTGGLEVASPRILDLINKGLNIDQVSRVAQNFRAAGIFVHAYLMYGFPTQTLAEHVESLENVRKLFNEGALNSAHWHRFLCTVHSPVGREPEKFGIRLNHLSLPKEGLFARYAVPFAPVKRENIDLDEVGRGLRDALYNYMHGVALERPAAEWIQV